MRYVLIAFSVIIGLLLQVTVFPSLPYISVTPNILLMVTVAFSIMYGQMYGLFIGVICGFLMDLYSGSQPGFTALLFACFGYICGGFARTFDYEDFKLPAAVILFSDFMYGAVVYVTSFMIGGSISVLQALFYVILPEVVYTGVVTVFLYPVLIYFNRRISERSQKREKKFSADQ